MLNVNLKAFGVFLFYFNYALRVKYSTDRQLSDYLKAFRLMQQLSFLNCECAFSSSWVVLRVLKD